MSVTSQFDPAALRAAVKTTQEPHQTLCFVKGVTDSSIEASFSFDARGWVYLPVSEVVSAEVVKEVKFFHGTYSLVRLILQDSHPVTELAALSAQVKYLQNSASPSCTCDKRAPSVTLFDGPRPVDECIRNCQDLQGCESWWCYLGCFFLAE